MKKTWMIIFALLLSVLLLGCAGAEEEGEEYIGTFVSEEPSYCPDCDIDVYTGKYSLHWHTWFCPQCGEATPNDTDTHYSAACDAPDTCLTCGASGVEVEYVDCNRNEQIQHSDTQHWVICADCGRYLDYHFEHWSYCDNPTVCGFCEEADVIITADNIVHSDEATQEQRYDDTHHWWYCTGCGKDNLWPTLHEGYCDENVCRTCDQEGVTLGEIYHVDLDYAWVKMNDTYCGRVCNSCGGFDDYILPHRADCSTPDTCSNCGSVGITAEYSHDYERTFDKTHHWYACTECGEIADKERHEANCFTSDVCYICEAEGIDALLREHGNWYTEFVPSHNATHCWSECPECGERFDEERHYTTDCTKPDVCEWCGNSGVDCVVYHSYETFDMSGGHFYTANAAYDENGHWWTCADCGKKTVYDHAVNAANLCVACGYQPAEPCKHPVASWTYETDGEYAHQAWCGDCGAQMFFDTQDGPSEYGDHSDVCSEPDVCRFCGAEDAVMMDTVHSTKTELCHDTTMHWQGCTDCGEVLDLRTMKNHTYKDYVCTECGYTPFTDILGTFTYSEDSAWCSDCERDVYTGVYTRTECWFACPECSKILDEPRVHIAYCDDPDVCIYCGATDVVVEMICAGYEYDMYHDAYYHWEGCAICGTRFDRVYGHEAECSNPNVCIYCGASDVYMEEIWHEETKYEFDQYCHWEVCDACGEKTAYEKHSRSCMDEPGVCQSCKASGDEVELSTKHSSRVNWTSIDAMQHQPTCARCGELAGDPVNHLANCNEPMHCIQCGADQVTADYSHEIDYADDPVYDNTHHWYVCTICGEPAEGERHYNSHDCTDPKTCTYCDAESVDTILYHSYDCFDDGVEDKIGPVFSSDEGHWWHCNGCGDETVYPHDFGSGNICVTCWYVKDNRVPGDADQDGVVTLEDVTLLLAYLADSTVDIHLGNSNVNDDTGVDADDLLTLLQLVSGWDIELK